MRHRARLILEWPVSRPLRRGRPREEGLIPPSMHRGRPLMYPRTQHWVTDSGCLARGPWKGVWYGCVNPKCRCHYENPRPRGV